MIPISTQVLNAFALTINGLATTGLNVYKNRMHNFSDDELPGIRVFDDDEMIENEDIEGVPFMQQRTIVLTVEAVTRENETLDATLKRIQMEIEMAIAENTTLGGLCNQMHCKLISAVKQRDDNSDVQAGQLKMTWHAVAVTMSDRPNEAIQN